MTRELHCTEFQASIGLAVYALGFGVFPLVSTSFSEEIGRRPLYIGSLVGHILMHLMVALWVETRDILVYKSHYGVPRSKNIRTVIIARFLAGGFGSTGAVMVGGTIADIWRPHEFVCHFHTCFRYLHSSRRSLPMSIYSLAAVGGTGLGPVAAGWVEMNPHLQWRWIQWIHMMFVVSFTTFLLLLILSSLTGTILVLVVAVMKETRSTIILIKLAKKLRQDTGDHQYRARAEVERGNIRSLLYISCTRPLCTLWFSLIWYSDWSDCQIYWLRSRRCWVSV